MLFNSIEFIIFFLVVTHVYFLLPHKYRWFHLLASSCYFYMVFVPVYILILFGTIVIDYFAGILISKAQGASRKLFLIISLVANIGVLVVFKYYNFFIENLNTLSGSHLPLLSILLPIGLSFHTFQAMSYTIEVYRGNQHPEKHFGYYALYVMFYPQLVAGPIERPQNILHQFKVEQKFSYINASNGLKLMLWGLFKKVVVADRLALFVNKVFDHSEDYQGLPLIVASVFFSFQIFFDFSGYSDIALGSAKVMGFDLMENFDRPYSSKSIKEFWSKWHISLSTWFRDYLYIPLGGNRKSVPRWLMNLMIVFLISGLWHGASWNFVIWGGIHGLLLILGILLTRIGFNGTGIPLLNKLAVFSLVTVAWVFFRAATFSDAIHIITNMFNGIITQAKGVITNHNQERNQFLYLNFPKQELFISIGLLIFVEWIHRLQGKNRFVELLNNMNISAKWALYTLMLYSIVFYGVFEKNQFIYFQF